MAAIPLVAVLGVFTVWGGLTIDFGSYRSMENATQGRRENLLDIGSEDVAVHGSVDHQRGGEAAGAQAGDERRYLRGTATTSRRPRGGASVPTRHVGARPGLIDEDQPVRV